MHERTWTPQGNPREPYEQRTELHHPGPSNWSRPLISPIKMPIVSDSEYGTFLPHKEPQFFMTGPDEASDGRSELVDTQHLSGLDELAFDDIVNTRDTSLGNALVPALDTYPTGASTLENTLSEIIDLSTSDANTVSMVSKRNTVYSETPHNLGVRSRNSDINNKELDKVATRKKVLRERRPEGFIVNLDSDGSFVHYERKE